MAVMQAPVRRSRRAPVDEEVQEAPVAVKTKPKVDSGLKYYRVLGSPHVEKVDGEDVMYFKGGIVPSTRDLVKAFPNKFEKVRGPNGGDDSDPVREGPAGEDVSDFFPDAEAADLKVFKSGTNYVVIDVGDVNTALNTEPLTNRAAVTRFLQGYLKA